MKQASFYAFCAILGGAAGFVNGFVGTGGGIVLMFGMMLLCRNSLDRYTLTLAVCAVFSVVSAFAYVRSGNLPLKECAFYLIPALLGGSAGAFFFKKISLKTLDRIFSLLVIIAGIIMLFKKQ
ncbi:MAG: sulfite exporter TauE/SafE family protein [Firmicutes bacterium]|nr:sulfite exporter TauE/SafE family protein [Bacillota bacterium]